MYLGGRSAQGVYDLAGNLWEWCRNERDDPRRTQAGGDGSRLLPGGSWGTNQGGARADYRGFHPYGSRGRSGFRVVCAAPIR